MSYHDTTKDFYKQAALTPDVGLCCTTTPIWKLPELDIPVIMQQMNYGCGSTVHPRDLSGSPTVLYVGVGGGMELLQFAYFSRKKNGVIGIDVVDEMLDASGKNFVEAEQLNPWFKSDFVDLRKGDALHLPVADNSVDVASQNCLFNIFKIDDLKLALQEMYRVLKPNGRLVMSDPISEDVIPDALRNDEKLRAACLSGVIPLQEYIRLITSVGFGTVEIRAKRPYRILDPMHYSTDKQIYIESVEVCAIKDPMPADGPCVFTGKSAIYFGKDEFFDDGKGHVLMQNQPLAVCDKTAGALSDLKRKDIFVSESTWFYDGGGCC
ncbi:MAG TPA: arsenosugar biosynthesis arsenite methyltransferase ArsM [Flavobacteriales bacterium]|nr:SAM-dependent methyltransferase [Flavobacteriales bacterium]HRE75047.1 arsenosugar biosynthesis arsenite methyltransferase ArsM [Flavobacteriales bacterium]HRE96898.1 arsenosugar biosynthesis arsenite methyltransferase ArsM [Flavobacteriales bacterium]HRJ35388.1 arsenosugar biosynthesis arsenite methyltransferase ArsM [Flavobacteriales bacterium]HRJ39942.1 arsenosugar biosynthesis arsenite methyltransferase ArsM [Flavobacteriales bacterium]